MSAIISINDLYIKFEKSNDYILKDINLEIEKGIIVGLIGKSGIGKSTLLKAINGIIPKREKAEVNGKIYINNKSIDEFSISEISVLVGTVFQNPDDQIVFPTVKEELAFGLENLCIKREAIVDQIQLVSEILNIEALIDRNPNSLSGGEKQLVTIASIMCMGADVLLLDEALSFLDDEGKRRVKLALHTLKQSGKTVVMVEHDLDNLSLADTIYELREGRLMRYDKDEQK
jgi:energy-coupling factor transport system ATP-binding protein